MEQEFTIQDSFDNSSFDFGVMMDQPGDFAIDVVAEEDPKSVKKDSTGFVIAGLLSILAGAGIIVAANADLGFKQLLPYFIGGGIAALGFGLVKAFRKVFSRRKLNLPSLTLRRKVQRQEPTRTIPNFNSSQSTVASKFQKANAAAHAALESAKATYAEASKGKKLGKSFTNKVFMGVASGLAEYAGVNAAFIRMLFVMAFFFSAGLVTILYIFLGIVLPQKKPNYRQSN